VTASNEQLTERQTEILAFIERTVDDRGYPPSVREIGTAVGLASPSTVHSHLHTLQRLGYLRRHANEPRAIEVTGDTASGTTAERRPTRHVPLVGDVAAGTGVLAQEQVEELVPLPADFTGDGELFMLRVRGDSMIDVGILEGDFVVARVQSEARNGDVVVAGIPGDEATIKTFRRSAGRVTLLPANERLEPMEFAADEVVVYGKVVTVLRRL
jgi:repressor LexA